MGRLRAWLKRDEGMNTAEYAVGTLAAVAFAGLAAPPWFTREADLRF